MLQHVLHITLPVVRKDFDHIPRSSSHSLRQLQFQPVDLAVLAGREQGEAEEVELELEAGGAQMEGLR